MHTHCKTGLFLEQSKRHLRRKLQVCFPYLKCKKKRLVNRFALQSFICTDRNEEVRLASCEKPVVFRSTNHSYVRIRSKSDHVFSPFLKLVLFKKKKFIVENLSLFALNQFYLLFFGISLQVYNYMHYG